MQKKLITIQAPINTATEQWRLIDNPDIPNHYYVSTKGRVYNGRTRRATTGSSINTNGYKPKTKESASKHFYRVFAVYSNLPPSPGSYEASVGRKRKCISLSIHRLVATAFIPNPDNLPEVNHINHDGTDNRVENLEWVSHRQNTAVITEKQVERILKYLAKGLGATAISRKLKIGAHHIANIKQKPSIWRDIKDKFNQRYGVALF